MKIVSIEKKLFDRLIEECTGNIGEVEKTQAENEHEYKYSSCTLYIVLFSLFFTISIGIGIYCTYFYWYLKKYDGRVILDTRTETTIYATYKWDKLKK